MTNIITEIGKKARAAAEILSTATTESKNAALNFAAESLVANTAKIIAENKKDLDAAEKAGQNSAFIDRLKLDENRISAIAKGLKEIALLDDPVGKIQSHWTRPNGLDISRVSTPLGVIGIIYESRPNVTADAGALCLKSGNASILRGGSESFHSSQAILACLQEGLKKAGLSEDSIQSIPSTDRALVGDMLRAAEYIDVIVPRGGKGLIARVIEESKIPLFQHLDGNCHTYIHEKANLEMALKIIVNAKMRRTGICGATESLVIDRKISAEFLPKIVDVLTQKNCEIRGDGESQKIDGRIKNATEEDFGTEYLDAIISVKIVGGIGEAIAHVKKYHSKHTDAIITDEVAAAERFFREIDSAIVMHNASTQFADGGEFGMGAEIGIATGKMHARGPVGVEQLCTYKYIVKGNGAVRG
jgi:glutamate-5-semialdehyde dehydrogenase